MNQDVFILTDRPAPENHSDPYAVTQDMIAAGVKLYFAYDYEEDEPKALVAEIFLTARDMWCGKPKG